LSAESRDIAGTRAAMIEALANSLVDLTRSQSERGLGGVLVTHRDRGANALDQGACGSAHVLIAIGALFGLLDALLRGNVIGHSNLLRNGSRGRDS